MFSSKYVTKIIISYLGVKLENFKRLDPQILNYAGDYKPIDLFNLYSSPWYMKMSNII